MRNKFIAFSLLFVFAAKAFSAPANSACDWVDQEALAALGLVNAVLKVEPQVTGIPDDHCTFAAPNAPIPFLMVGEGPVSGDLVLKPICQWSDLQLSNIGGMGVCFIRVGHRHATLTLMVAPSSDSKMYSTLSAQAERLFNKHLEAAQK
jgi:hypothetical protein